MRFVCFLFPGGVGGWAVPLQTGYTDRIQLDLVMYRFHGFRGVSLGSLCNTSSSRLLSTLVPSTGDNLHFGYKVLSLKRRDEHVPIPDPCLALPQQRGRAANFPAAVTGYSALTDH